MFHVIPSDFAVLCFLAFLAWAACNDALEFKIPNSATFAIASLYPIYVLANPLPVDWIGAILVAVATFVPGFVLFSAGGFGGGDVKLLSAVSLWAGPKFILPLLVTMGIAGGLLALLVWVGSRLRLGRFVACGDVSLTNREYAAPLHLPYGVAIAAGAGLVGLRLLSG